MKFVPNGPFVVIRDLGPEPDILGDIDAATDEWDRWDGYSPDAARWMPDALDAPDGEPEAVTRISVTASLRSFESAMYGAQELAAASGCSVRHAADALASAVAAFSTDDGFRRVTVTMPRRHGMQALWESWLADLVEPAEDEPTAPKRRLPRPSAVPPMWAVVPTRERRQR